ncbi:hypothetical protein HDV05_005649 [Chytridiales sp. JEL 0842]|nr:hypothetical protein HDV05_005649 [Chytridiales sp. JEL 0842]
MKFTLTALISTIALVGSAVASPVKLQTRQESHVVEVLPQLPENGKLVFFDIAKDGKTFVTNVLKGPIKANEGFYIRYNPNRGQCPHQIYKYGQDTWAVSAYWINTKGQMEPSYTYTYNNQTSTTYGIGIAEATHWGNPSNDPAYPEINTWYVKVPAMPAGEAQFWFRCGSYGGAKGYVETILVYALPENAKLVFFDIAKDGKTFVTNVLKGPIKANEEFNIRYNPNRGHCPHQLYIYGQDTWTVSAQWKDTNNQVQPTAYGSNGVEISSATKFGRPGVECYVNDEWKAGKLFFRYCNPQLRMF